MKLQCLLFFTAFLSISVKAQDSYELKLSKGTYADLSAATELTYSLTDSGYYFNANLIFPVFARNADFNQVVSIPSNGAFVDAKGYIAVYESPGYSNTIVIQALYNNAFTRVDGLTKVAAKIEGTTGSRVLKIQWKDVVYNNDLSQKINFQVWIDETSKNISIHYGPSGIKTPQTGGYVGLVVFKPNFIDLAAAASVIGGPTTPQLVTNVSTLSGLTLIDSIPSNGTIYTFKPSWPTAIKSEDIVAGESFKVFPNPSYNMITISSVTEQDIQMYSIAGQRVSTINIEAGKSEKVDVSSMPSGCYILKGTDGGVQTIQVIR